MSSAPAVPAGVRHRAGAAPSTAGRGPPPSTPASRARNDQPKQRKVFLVYWAVCFATAITWLFAVAAASDDAWLQFEGYPLLKLGERCEFSASFCDYYKTGTAFQFFAAIVISATVVVMIVAAFKPAPATGRLGAAAGTMLLVFSVLQLAAFSIMAASAGRLNRDNDNYFQIKAGPTIGVAVIAWVFGLAGGSAILLLRPHATPGQDGPLRRFSRREGVRSAPRPRAPSPPSGVTI
ncbi:unnamed protein product [Ectocarpus sp. 6 AP-2014]